MLLYMLKNWENGEVHLQDSLSVFACFQSLGFVFFCLQLIKPVLEYINWAACPSLVIWLSTVLAWLLGSSVFYFCSIFIRVQLE